MANDTYTTPNGVFQGQPDIAYPKTPGFEPSTPVPVGGVILAEGNIEYNTDRRTVSLKVRNNLADRPIRIGSHFHFFEVNRFMEFDREAAFGMHLNIPTTTAIRFEPGEEKEVEPRRICREAPHHRLQRPHQWICRIRRLSFILSL